MRVSVVADEMAPAAQLPDDPALTFHFATDLEEGGRRAEIIEQFAERGGLLAGAVIVCEAERARRQVSAHDRRVAEHDLARVGIRAIPSRPGCAAAPPGDCERCAER